MPGVNKLFHPQQKIAYTVSMKNPKTIVITGASSGIGKELSLQYAASNTTLFLIARNQERLEETAELCREQGAEVTVKSIDVTDTKAMSEFLSKTDRENPIDLVIANAGISAGTEGGSESWAQVENIFHTNINGVINTIHPVIPHMRNRKSGQIAIVSSLAGYRGLPSCPSYSASKAAVKSYGEGIRGMLAEDNVGVTVITPGYIKTHMTDANNFYMPQLMNATKAAKIIKKRLKRNPARIAFPFLLYACVWFISILPPILTDKLLSKLPKKSAQ